MESKNERISKGLLVQSNAEFKKQGGSIYLIIPFHLVTTMGIEEGNRCDIYRNNKGQLIIEPIKP